MISAAWRSRRRHRPIRAARQLRASPCAKIGRNWKRALEDLANIVHSSQENCINLILQAAFATLQRLEACKRHSKPLLASVTNSASEKSAFLPSKNRPVGGGGPKSASSGDGGNDRGKKSESEQRILISEVCQAKLQFTTP